jgi:hypothetical protein
LRPRPAAGIDWPHWTRLLDRRRRTLVVPAVWPGWVYRDMTRASFRLDGIDVQAADVTDALTPPRSQPLRSRPARRLRAHIAILRSLDRSRRQGLRLSPGRVVRWYTSVSSGLSTSGLAAADDERLAAVVRRINSPQRRLQPAVLETARLHAELLADPMFPSFNGILARLLLHAHLAACGLPPVVFDADSGPIPIPAAVTATLLARLEVSLNRLAG